MNASDLNFFGTRLKLARKMAGMSLQDLSDNLNNIVSKQALNKYEQGLMHPSIEVLNVLSETLKLKPDFFLKKDKLELGLISFRKNTSLLKKDEDSIIEKVRYYIERFNEIEAILNLSISFENPLRDLLINTYEDVENAANKLREIWELGYIPIPNITEMLELKGIKVFLIDNVHQFDGLAVITETGIPVVAINTSNKSTERLRFTIIHELAHLLLKFGDQVKTDKKVIEKLCHYFSSCFLIPKKMLLEMIGNSHRNYLAISELIVIKEYYGISIRAILHRLSLLNIITPNYYQRWVIYMSKTYGQKEEPGKYIGQEKQKLFNQLINRALAEEYISISKAASLLNTNIYDIRKGIANA